MSSPSISVDFSDFAHAASALEARGFEVRAGQTVGAALRKSANLVRAKTRAELKGHRKTGRMAGRIRTKFKGTGMAMEANVRTTARQSNMIVGGVRPHAISSDKPMPMWGGKGKGRGITGFAQVVQHPGFKGDPFFHRGIAASQDGIQAILEESGQVMVRELAYRLRGK